MREKETTAPDTESTSRAEKEMDETSSTSKRCKAKDETTSSSDTEKEMEDTSSTTSETDEVKKVGLEESPSESAAAGGKGSNTVTPGKMTGKPQNVFSPPSRIGGDRNGSGKTPGEESYQGKSVEPDLMKSPLFIELSKNIDSFKGAFEKKFSSMEKSFQARLDNIEQLMKKVEKFYSQPFYKPVVDEQANAQRSETVAERAGFGNLRFKD